MKISYVLFYIFLFVFGCIGLPISTYAADCNDTLTITHTRDLSFGDHVAGAGGTITVDTAGVRTPSAGVFLAGGTVWAGEYTFSNSANNCQQMFIYLIALPAGATLDSVAPGTMALNNFTTSIGNTVGSKFKLSTTPKVSIGATLMTNPAQAQGAYSGTYDFVFVQGNK